MIVMVSSDVWVIEAVDWYDDGGFVVQPLIIKKDTNEIYMNNIDLIGLIQASDMIDPLFRV